MEAPLLLISKNFASILGWTGTVSYLLAYLLLTLNWIKSNQRIYHVLNIPGATGLAINAFFFRDYPNVFVNVAWGFIAFAAVFLSL